MLLTLRWLHRKQLTISFHYNISKTAPSYPPTSHPQVFSFLGYMDPTSSLLSLNIKFLCIYPLYCFLPDVSISGPGTLNESCPCTGNAGPSSTLPCTQHPKTIPIPFMTPMCCKDSVYDALQTPDFFLLIYCLDSYFPVLLPTSHFALHLHLFLVNCCFQITSLAVEITLRPASRDPAVSLS